MAPTQSQIFANDVIPEADVLGLMKGFAQAPGEPLLSTLWERAGARCGADGKQRPLGLAGRVLRIGENAVACVALPPPRQIGDAVLVAAVASATWDDGQLAPRSVGAARYFLLESTAVDSKGKPAFAIRERVGSERKTHGDGPAPEPRWFAEAVCEIVNGSSPPRAGAGAHRPELPAWYWLDAAGGRPAFVAFINAGSKEAAMRVWDDHPILLLDEFPALIEAMNEMAGGDPKAGEAAARIMRVVENNQKFARAQPEYPGDLLRLAQALIDADGRASLERALVAIRQARELSPSDRPEHVRAVALEAQVRTRLEPSSPVEYWLDVCHGHEAANAIVLAAQREVLDLIKRHVILLLPDFPAAIAAMGARRGDPELAALCTDKAQMVAELQLRIRERHKASYLLLCRQLVTTLCNELVGDRRKNVERALALVAETRGLATPASEDFGRSLAAEAQCRCALANLGIDSRKNFDEALRLYTAANATQDPEAADAIAFSRNAQYVSDALASLGSRSRGTTPPDDPRAKTARRRLLIRMMMADGQIDEPEIAVVIERLQKLEARVTGDPERGTMRIEEPAISRADVISEVQVVLHEHEDVEVYGRALGTLDEDRRGSALLACAKVAMADGVVTGSERTLLQRIAMALGIKYWKFKDVLQRLDGVIPTAPPIPCSCEVRSAEPCPHYPAELAPELVHPAPAVAHSGSTFCPWCGTRARWIPLQKVWGCDSCRQIVPAPPPS